MKDEENEFEEGGCTGPCNVERWYIGEPSNPCWHGKKDVKPMMMHGAPWFVNYLAVTLLRGVK